MIALIIETARVHQNKNVLLSSEIFRILVAKHINYSDFSIIMVKGIPPTPILKGKDAERFLEELRNPPFPEKRKKILEEAERIYRENPLTEDIR